MAHMGQYFRLAGRTNQVAAKARGKGRIMDTLIAGGTAFDGNWHSIAFRRNGTVFVDGANVVSTTAVLNLGGLPPNRTSLMHMLAIGNPMPSFAKGSIQHAAIWNRALSDSEIMAIQTARTINPTPTPTPTP
jgi:hypothetical protein